MSLLFFFFFDKILCPILVRKSEGEREREGGGERELIHV